MAPLDPIFEFTYHDSAASLEAPLGRSAAGLHVLAERCDSGEAYDQEMMRVRRKWRAVAIPDRELDITQRRISAFLFPVDIAMGAAVHGYVARRSILTNAEPHIGAKHLQKFDIADFFSNITTERITASLEAAGFGADAATIIARLVSCEGRLPLGARTSPRISNLVLRDFDEAVMQVAENAGLTYTRYADDLSFSGTHAFDVSDVVASELTRRGFQLNASKTRTFKHGQPMFVTGLSVSDDKYPRLRKRLKAQLRKEFYFVEKFGLDEHAERTRRDAREAEGRIMGLFHYARSIEPEFAAGLERNYPKAHATLIPRRTDDRIERVRRHRENFLDMVTAAPAQALPFYTPTIELGPMEGLSTTSDGD
ncbi:reverse transcriptase family protein [Microbacterium tumbae]